jgi:Flp pilus assembly protein TadG
MMSERSGTAAAEMALVLPFLLVLMFGALEIGNYFMNEHTLVKAVRDGARFASRQSFTNYGACSGDVSEPALTSTKNVVMNGYLAGGTIITPNIKAANIAVTTRCATTAGTETMGGIYTDRTTGAQIVRVSATVDYRPVLAIMGFTGIGLHLNAASEAAVAGL